MTSTDTAPDPKLMVGTQLAADIVARAGTRAAALAAEKGVTPCLVAVLVGSDPASVTYVKMKRRRSRKAGLRSRVLELPEQTTTEQLVEQLHALSSDPDVHGILLQHPVPGHVDERAAFEAIAPEKDVDGVTLRSFAAMSFDDTEGFDSCTPGGIVRLLDHYDVDLVGKDVVVVGRSAILGKPVGMLLLGRHATVTYCHSRTRDLADHVGRADVVVAAVGRPEFIRGEWIKEGAVVVDAGYNPGNVGDVEFGAAYERASLITPVPGGVGPMTIAVLIEQTVTAAERLTLR